MKLVQNTLILNPNWNFYRTGEVDIVAGAWNSIRIVNPENLIFWMSWMSNKIRIFWLCAHSNPFLCDVKLNFCWCFKYFGPPTDPLKMATPKSALPQKITAIQDDINCRASSQADFILNYFLSNLLSNFLSNSPSPPSPAGRQEQLMSPCCNIIQIVSSVWKYFFMPPCP